jgi:hypothetical protein
MHGSGVLVSVLAVLSALGSPRGEKAVAGQPVPDFELRTVVGGDGRTKLSEFRGQPVLIAWYSTVFAGIEGARIAADLEREINGDLLDAKLVVILMEIKNHDATYLRALQMAQLPGARCWLMKNQDLPVVFDDTTGPPPKMALIGVDGTLLYAGSYQGANKVKKLLETEVEKVEKGWGTDPLARKARALAWGQRKLGEAHALLEPALGGSASPELTTLAAEIEKRFDTLVRSVNHFAEQGEATRMAGALAALRAATDVIPAWEARMSGMNVDQAAALLVSELDGELDDLLKPTLKAKPKKGLAEKLRAFAGGKASGTKVGARALSLAEAVERAQGEL